MQTSALIFLAGVSLISIAIIFIKIRRENQVRNIVAERRKRRKKFCHQFVEHIMDAELVSCWHLVVLGIFHQSDDEMKNLDLILNILQLNSNQGWDEVSFDTDTTGSRVTITFIQESASCSKTVLIEVLIQLQKILSNIH